MNVDELRDRTVISVEEAGRLFGLGRHAAYQEARRFLDTDGAEGLPTLRFGRRLFCPVPALLRMLDARPDPNPEVQSAEAIDNPGARVVPLTPRSTKTHTSKAVHRDP